MKPLSRRSFLKTTLAGASAVSLAYLQQTFASAEPPNKAAAANPTPTPPAAKPGMGVPHAIERSVLPIPDQPYVGLTTYDAKDPDTIYPPIQELRPPKGAPNVLIVLLDDVGFGASSAFGGPCQTPTFEKLAANGLKYTRFHTCALCAPTRQALLTGRNHHSCNMGSITEFATSAPGSTSLLPNTISPIARTLKLNGYSTAQFGKCHEVPTWQTGPVGPFDAWPSAGGGFEYFYGFIAAETNQYYPAIYEGTMPVEPDKTPEEGYHFTVDMTNKAIQWIRQQKALVPDKPFFIYFSTGATHAPHHVPKDWINKYKGKFDQGWDKLREETLARQKKLGVVPQDCQLTERNAGIPAWDDVSAELKPIIIREMEIYAAFLEHTDYNVGRLIDTIKEMGILNDTLIYVIIGDNGASAEGSMKGTFNEMVTASGFSDLETPAFLKANLDKFGGPLSYNHYSVGWAHAMDAPYQWTKQVASHFGGIRNGTIVHWPNGIKAKGELRNQFHHVIDVAPTILEAAGLPEPIFVNGVQQRPIEGVSMAYSFDEAKSPERHDTQYFEMNGNRGIYHKGWTAVTKHRTPWETTSAAIMPAFDDDVWELYDTTTDWSQAKNLAKENPDMLHELQRQWLIEAVKYSVLPLDDRFAERTNPEKSGRPVLVKGTRQILYGGMSRLNPALSIGLFNRSLAITGEVIVPDSGAEGVIYANGGVTGGISLYVKEGKLKFCYSFFGLQQFIIEGNPKIPSGKHQVRMEFAYDGGGMAKGGTVTLYTDGKKIGEGRVDKTHPGSFSLDETIDVGNDFGSPVTTDYPARKKFNGEINWVEIASDKDAVNNNHMLSPEELYRLTMAGQ